MFAHVAIGEMPSGLYPPAFLHDAGRPSPRWFCELQWLERAATTAVGGGQLNKCCCPQIWQPRAVLLSLAGHGGEGWEKVVLVVAVSGRWSGCSTCGWSGHSCRLLAWIFSAAVLPWSEPVDVEVFDAGGPP